MHACCLRKNLMALVRAWPGRKYPDSVEGSTQPIDQRDQDLFADF